MHFYVEITMLMAIFLGCLLPRRSH